MATSLKQMMEAANAAVPKITPMQAREMIGKGNTLVVDVRDAPEVEKSGKIAGAVHVSRGMLEFRADPASPFYDKNFSFGRMLKHYPQHRGHLTDCLIGDLFAEKYGDLFGSISEFAELPPPLPHGRTPVAA